jgi:hypothetical protein
MPTIESAAPRQLERQQTGLVILFLFSHYPSDSTAICIKRQSVPPERAK